MSSYREILKSSSITAGAQVINVASGIVRMKAAAVLLGPAGVGLIGLYINLIQVASAFSSMGVGNVGTREIAAAHAEGGQTAVDRTRHSLFWLSLALALGGGAAFWMCRDLVKAVFLPGNVDTGGLGWIALGVALSVGAGSQAALLTGLRQIKQLALVTIVSGLFGTAFGLSAVWFWGEAGIMGLVLAGPISSFIVGHIFVARLPKPATRSIPLQEMLPYWRSLLRLGFPFMLAGMVAVVGQLLVRALVQADLGAAALGHFQAAWMIGMTYLGFVFGAMGTDYYPRLSAAKSDHVLANRLVNEQTEVALLLCGPVLLLMIGCAPWIVLLLYSAEFGEAVDVLRWQLLGDILKILSWPLGFLILAQGSGRIFLLCETLAMGVFVLFCWVGLPILGLTATGIGFFFMYVFLLPLVWAFARRSTGFRWSLKVVRSFLIILIFGGAVFLGLLAREWLSLLITLSSTALYTAYSAFNLRTRAK